MLRHEVADGVNLNTFIDKGGMYVDVEYSHLRAKMSCCKQPFEGKLYSVIKIVSVSTDERGQGTFTRFIEELESYTPNIVVESIVNKRLAAFLKRRGYVKCNFYSKTETLWLWRNKVEVGYC